MFLCATFTRIGITLFEVPHRSFGLKFPMIIMNEQNYSHGVNYLHGLQVYQMLFLRTLFF